MNIRIAHPADSIAIAEITAEGLGYNCTPEMIAQNIAALDSSHARLFVAEVDGEVVRRCMRQSIFLPLLTF